MNTSEILTVILLITATVLCIALIYLFYLMTKSVQSTSSDIRELSNKLSPLIASVYILSEKLIRVTNEFEIQLQISETIIFDIRNRVDKILNLEAKLRNGAGDAAMLVTKNMNAVGKGIEIFWRKYSNR